jgi:hypothetical protein
MNDNILNMCQDCRLPLFDSRSKRYDNGSNMWGKRWDIQSHTLTLNEWAFCCPLFPTLIESDDQWSSQMVYQSSNTFQYCQTSLSFFLSSPYQWDLYRRWNVSYYSYFLNPQGQLHRRIKPHQVSTEKNNLFTEVFECTKKCNDAKYCHNQIIS